MFCSPLPGVGGVSQSRGEQGFNSRPTWEFTRDPRGPGVRVLPGALLPSAVIQGPSGQGGAQGEPNWGHGRCHFQAFRGPPFRLGACWDDSAAPEHARLQRIRCAQHRADLHRAEALRGLDPGLHMRQPTSGHFLTFHGHSGLLLQAPLHGAMTTGIGGSEQHRGRRATCPDVYKAALRSQGSCKQRLYRPILPIAELKWSLFTSRRDFRRWSVASQLGPFVFVAGLFPPATRPHFISCQGREKLLHCSAYSPLLRGRIAENSRAAPIFFLKKTTNFHVAAGASQHAPIAIRCVFELHPPAGRCAAMAAETALVARNMRSQHAACKLRPAL